MTNYKHIFFDLDRTLWDFDANSRLTFLDMYQKFNLKDKGIIDFDKFFHDYQKINHQLWDDYRKGLIEKEFLSVERFYQTLLSYQIDDRVMAAQMANDYITISPTKTILFPYSVEILEYLKDKNYVLHIITNGFPEVQHIKLRTANLEKYFDQLIISEEVGFKKPNEEIFKLSMKKAGAKAVESVMIGDDLEVDILGGKNVGLTTIWVNYLQETGKAIPDYEVNHLEAIKEIL